MAKRSKAFPDKNDEAIFLLLRVRSPRSFALGRVQNSGEAIGIVNADQKVPPEVLGELRAITGIRQGRVIEIH